ncbi:phage major capsid protein [Rhizobium sp.]
MQHIMTAALASAALLPVLDIKDGGDDPADVVTKALDALSKTVDDRIKAIETKAGDAGKLDERLKALETKANRPGDGKETKVEPSEERKAFGSYLRHGNNAPAEELKVLTVSSDPQGGYLAPPEMSTEMIRDITEVSPIRSLATVRSTSSPSVSYPKRTGITNAKWKGETQPQEGSEPGFGQVEIVVREVNTYVDISNQLLADSAGVAETETRLALAEDFGKKEGAAFIKGAGVNDPEGILVNADVGYLASGNAATLGSAPADKMIELFYSLKAAYRNRGTWLMNGTTLAAVRKLKDGQNNYLWQPSLAVGQPETILGRPVVEDPEMPDIGAGTEPIVFGDIATGYRIVDRESLSVLVNPYLRATDGITRVHATRRVGGKVVQPAAIKKLRCATS